ncbi:hypothetical protein [Pseudoclavibacter sp. RFBA6]|uniref:hypothetical protein n=1 Tax=Pseudoclavibacter sp. RFBA6 TaxID=2080573 RepID=UPI0011B099B3|nr:hypothetical protein [Pseudoclavibacter sp. RFBA6]
MAKSGAHREHVVSVRLDDAERRAWESESRQDGYGQIARWARELVNRQIEARKDNPPADPRQLEPQLLKPLREHTKALNRIGRLLAELVASGQVLTEADLRRIERAVLAAEGGETAD